MRGGYDPSSTTDPIYFNDFTSQSFVQVDEALFREIKSGNVRM